MRKLTCISGTLVLVGCLLALPAGAAPVGTAGAPARAADAQGLVAHWLEAARWTLGWLVPLPTPRTSAVTAGDSSCGAGPCTGTVTDPTTQAGEVIDPDG